MSAHPKPDEPTRGQLTELRKSQGRCLSCGMKLTYQWNSDPKTGFLNDFCDECFQKFKPAPQKTFNFRKERKAGVENLKRILGDS